MAWRAFDALVGGRGMDSLFDGTFDLTAMASAAGLGGGAVGAIAAALFFKGVIMRFLAQLAMTTIMTGIGFYALLNFLGYEIVPSDEVAQRIEMPGIFSPQSTLEPGAQPQSANSQFAMSEETQREIEEAREDGKKIVYMRRRPGR